MHRGGKCTCACQESVAGRVRAGGSARLRSRESGALQLLVLGLWRMHLIKLSSKVRGNLLREVLWSLVWERGSSDKHSVCTDAALIELTVSSEQRAN